MQRQHVGIAIAVFSLALSACATGESGSSASASPEATASAAAPKGVAAPAGSLLSKVSAGMTEAQVREATGAPTSETTYMTGKAFIPFYFGPTHQTDYKYKGEGRVIFARNRWSGAAKVIRVDYDPGEEGA